MLEARTGARAFVVAAILSGLSLDSSRVEAAKPKRETKDAAASRAEQKAIDVFLSGDEGSAVGMLAQALRACGPPDGCTPKTIARLHVSLGTVKGAGQGDYAGAQQEFSLALGIDPEVRLGGALANAELKAAFERARGSTAPSPKPAVPEPPPERTSCAWNDTACLKVLGEKAPEKPVTISELFHPEETAPPPRPKPLPPPPEEAKPELRWNWLSVRGILDFAYLSDANVCSRGAPAEYFCNDEGGARYLGRPQPNDDISRGFAISTTRLVLGYERVLFGGFTAGTFVGYAFGMAPKPAGGTAGLPLHLEVRATYTHRAVVFPQCPQAPEKSRAPTHEGMSSE